MPLSWLNRQIILRIGYSSAAFEVEVNGKKVGYSPDGITATEFNITKYAHDGSNKIAIIQHDDARVNEIYKGVKSGISDIKIICQPTIRVRDIICDTRLNDDGDGIAEFGIAVKCDALNPKRTKLNYTLRLRDTVILAEGNRELELDMRREDTVRFAVRIPKQALWSAGNPEMLRLDIINRIDGRIAECISREIGARSIDVNGNAMYVNGRIVKLYLAEYCAATEIGNIAASGYNGIIVSSDKASRTAPRRVRQARNLCNDVKRNRHFGRWGIHPSRRQSEQRTGLARHLYTAQRKELPHDEIASVGYRLHYRKRRHDRHQRI